MSQLNIRCLILLVTRNLVPIYIFVVTIVEGAVSFSQDSVASPSYLLEGYYICFASTKLIHKRL